MTDSEHFFHCENLSCKFVAGGNLLIAIKSYRNDRKINTFNSNDRYRDMKYSNENFLKMRLNCNGNLEIFSSNQLENNNFKKFSCCTNYDGWCTICVAPIAYVTRLCTQIDVSNEYRCKNGSFKCVFMNVTKNVFEILRKFINNIVRIFRS